MKSTKKTGFTLVELLVVIAVIGILFVTLISKVDFAVDKAKEAGAKTDLRSYQLAGQQMLLESTKGEYTLDEFNKNLEKQLQRGEETAKDPWGSQYELLLPVEDQTEYEDLFNKDSSGNKLPSIVAVSKGPDKIVGTKDDLIVIVDHENIQYIKGHKEKDNTEGGGEEGETPPEGETDIVFTEEDINILSGVDFSSKLKSYIYGWTCGHGEEVFDAVSLIKTDIKPDSSVSQVDLSLKGNGEVLAYKDKDDSSIIYFYLEKGYFILPEDASRMFQVFYELNEFDLTKYMYTKFTKDMSNMFESTGWAKSPSKIEFSKYFDTSNVTNMERMFAQSFCDITDLVLPERFNTSKVTNMNDLFCNTGINKMTTLNLGSEFYTKEVTTMNSMFYSTGKNSMTSLNLGVNFDVSKVEDMTYMFYRTGQLSMTSLNLGYQFNRICSEHTNMFSDTGNVECKILGPSELSSYTIEGFNSKFVPTDYTE